MQLSHLSMEAGLKVSLKWRPRDENEPADALTNGDFTGFDPVKRISVSRTTLTGRCFILYGKRGLNFWIATLGRHSVKVSHLGNSRNWSGLR